MVDAAQSFATPAAQRLPVFSTIGRTFRILAGAPLHFVFLSLLVAVPDFLRTISVDASGQTGLSSFIALAAIYLLLYFLAQVVLTQTAVEVDRGTRSSLSNSFKLGIRRYLPVVGAFLCSTLVILCGAILLIIPGLIAASALAVVIPVCTVEARGSIDSLNRSAALTKGERWRVFAILLLSVVPLIIDGLIEGIVGPASGHADAFLAIHLILMALWTPFSIVLGAAIYVELRRVKENDGLATVFD